MEHSFAPKFQQTNKIFGNNKNASATTKINTKFISNIQFSLTRSYAYIHTEFRVFGNSLHTQNTIIRTEQNRIKHNQISFSHVLKSENRKIVYREKLLSVQFSILERRSFRSYSVAFLASLSFIFCVVALLAPFRSSVRLSVRVRLFVRMQNKIATTFSDGTRFRICVRFVWFDEVVVVVCWRIYSRRYSLLFCLCISSESLLIEPTKQWKMQMYANVLLVWYGNDCLRCQRGDYVDVIVNGCVPFRFVLSFAQQLLFALYISTQFSSASVVCELVLKCSKNMFFSWWSAIKIR